MAAVNSHQDATCSSLYEQRVVKTGSQIIMDPQNQPEAVFAHLVTLNMTCPEWEPSEQFRGQKLLFCLIDKLC